MSSLLNFKRIFRSRQSSPVFFNRADQDESRMGLLISNDEENLTYVIDRNGVASLQPQRNCFYWFDVVFKNTSRLSERKLGTFDGVFVPTWVHP